MRFFGKLAVYLFWISTMILYPLMGMSIAEADPIDGIHYDKKKGTLTVQVQDVPLDEVLQTVSTASGFKLSIQADLNRPVTMDLTAVPLDKAIYRLVQPNSSAMIYSTKEDGAVVLTSVNVFDKGGASPSSPGTLPLVRRANRRNNVPAFADRNQATGGSVGSAGGGPVDKNRGGRNNRRNRDQANPNKSGSDPVSQTTGAPRAPESQGGGPSPSGGGRRGR